MYIRPKLSNPDAWWWVKADGVDVIKGLGESVYGKWCGDIDLNDGKLDQLHRFYSERLKFVNSIGLNERTGVHIMISDLEQALDHTQKDREFTINLYPYPLTNAIVSRHHNMKGTIPSLV